MKPTLRSWTSASCIWVLVSFLLTVRLPRSYPLFAFLTTNGKFDDFYNLVSFDSESPFSTVSRYVHPPLSIVIYRLLEPTKYFTIQDALIVFQLTSVFGLLLGTSRLVGSTRSAIMLLFTYPVVMGFFRANNEILLVATFMWAFSYLEINQDSRRGKFLLALGQLIEPSPFSLLIFPLRKVLLSATFIRITLLLSAVLLGFLAVGFEIQPIDYLTAIFRYLDEDVGAGAPALLHNHSLRAGISAWIVLLGGETSALGSIVWKSVFIVVVPILLSLPLMFRVIWRCSPDLIDRAIVGVTLTVALPTHSFSYRMIWFLVPLCLIFRQVEQPKLDRRRLLQMLLIFVLMQPKSFWLFDFSNTQGVFYEATLLDPVILMALFILTVWVLPSDLQFINGQFIKRFGSRVGGRVGF